MDMSDGQRRRSPGSPIANGTTANNTDDRYQTPVKKKKCGSPSKLLRRRSDGSPIIPRDNSMPTKTIYLIRHGHSQGQAANSNGLDRKSSPELLDCGLTTIGESQARNLSTDGFTQAELDRIELVISSPLTRALHTALIGFTRHDVLVHYDLGEIGSKAPENEPRNMKDVLNDLSSVIQERNSHYSNPDDASSRDGSNRNSDPITAMNMSPSFDFKSLQPHDWPRDYRPNVVKRDRLRNLLEWLYNERQETTIAIVCHYNVIRSLIIDSSIMNIRPKNATPICCLLHSNGDLILNDKVSNADV